MIEAHMSSPSLAHTHTHTQKKKISKFILDCLFFSDDVDTRAITRRLREDGSLIGVLSTDQSRTDDELLEMAQKWKIVGMLRFLYAVVSFKK